MNALAPLSLHSTVIRQDAESIVRELRPDLNRLAGTTVLVTGGSGFLCSYLLDTLAALNDDGLSPACRVLCVDNLRSGLSDRVAHLVGRPDFRFIQHDVSRPLDLDEDVHWIIHGASIASPTFYRTFPLETIDANVTGTRHMLELARQRRVRSMLYLSSSEIYGNPTPDAIPTPEDYVGRVSCTGPRACYDESKRLAETLCATYSRLYALPIKVIRPFNVFGPGQRLDDKRVIPDLVGDVIAGRNLTILSDGKATRSFCYVSDAVRAMWQVLLSTHEGEAFNVGNDEEELTIADLARRLQQAAGEPAPHVRFERSPDADYLTDNPERRCPDLRKIRRLVGWSPRVSLLDGLSKTLKHYRELHQEGGTSWKS